MSRSEICFRFAKTRASRPFGEYQLSRPRLDPAARRTVTLGIRCTPTERAQVRAAATAAGITSAAFARRVLLAAATDRRRPDIGPSPLHPEVRRELGRLGNNLNQVARALNSARGMPPAKLTALSEELGDVITELHLKLQRGAW